MRKAECLATVNKGNNSSQRVSKALDERAAGKSGKKSERANVFTRVSTHITLLIVSYLTLDSIGKLACSCSFLRSRLTLSLSGAPSVFLASLDHLTLTKPGPLVRVLERTIRLHCLDLTRPSQAAKRFLSCFAAAHQWPTLVLATADRLQATEGDAFEEPLNGRCLAPQQRCADEQAR